MAQGRKTGGRQKGTPNKATIARQEAEALSLAEAQAAVLAGVDLSALEGITGLQVMRLAMAAHLQAGNLDKAAAWGERVAPYETSKPVARDPNAGTSERTILIRGGLPDDDTVP